MVEYHPDRYALECFARGEILAQTELWILDHLRSGCPICQPTIDALLPGAELPASLDPRRETGAPCRSSMPLRAPTETDSTPRLRAAANRLTDSPAPFMSSAVNALPPRRQREPRREQAGPAAVVFGPAAGSGTASRGVVTAGSAGRDDRTGPGSMRGCDPRRASAGRAGSQAPDPDGDGEAWDRIFAKLEQRLVMVAAERSAAPRLLVELLQQPAGEQEALVRASRSFHSLALCDLLLDRSLEAGSHDSAEATAMAQLGILIAEHLDARYYGSAVVHDMKARAWAYLGNARRIGADFAGAEQALAFAEALSEEGSADPLEEARLLDLKALLLSDQGWFEQAAELLEAVIEIYEDVKDLHRKGRALISRGICAGRSGWPQLAIELIPQGLALLDRQIEPRLALTARQELAWFLSECGRCGEARRQLNSVRKGLAGTMDTRTELHLAWIESRIARYSGHSQEAELRLGRLLQRFASGGCGYDAALVLLDLASLHLEAGSAAEIRRLADDMLPAVLALDIHRQAAAALVTFQQAVQEGRATPSLVRDIAAYLQRARKNPRLSFQLVPVVH